MDRGTNFVTDLDSANLSIHTLGADGRSYMTDKQIVLSTAGSEVEARKIARHLVERQLAACVNIIPQIESIYRWQGEIETGREWLLLIKTRAKSFSAVREAILELHSYDLPECIAVAIENGSPEYLEWMADSLSNDAVP